MLTAGYIQNIQNLIIFIKQEYFWCSKMIDKTKLQNGNSSLKSYENITLKLAEDNYAWFNF